MEQRTIKEKTIALIDELKSTCQSYGLGNDGNEYKIITQVFLYKYLNDKFGYELKQVPGAEALREAEHWEKAYAEMDELKREKLMLFLSPDMIRLEPAHLIYNLWNQQTKGDFDKVFDDTMVDIAAKNLDIYSTQTVDGEKLPLFEKVTELVDEVGSRPQFARALVDKLVRFSFEEAFTERYDFFSDIFEYLIKDYNTNGGGKYAEYYTPKAIAKIMARLLVGDDAELHNVECYDPSAGTGTLLMALAHQIGEDRCTIYAQDISQRSNKMLKLNLLLNGLVSSMDHAVKGDTLLNPFHKSDDKKYLRQFDYVVSNPPFKMDFSDTRDDIEAQWSSRFWAGVPKTPKNKKESMAIYTCFVQHVVNSIKKTGKGAIVVPTGFVTAKGGVEHKILEYIVEHRIIDGVVSMPSNVFANTGTNVSVLFFDKDKKDDQVVLIDASGLGEDYKDNGLKKHRLTEEEINRIVNVFREHRVEEDFSVVVSYDEIKEKNYALNAGSYFEIKIEYVDITAEEFTERMNRHKTNLNQLFEEGEQLDKEIMDVFERLELNK